MNTLFVCLLKDLRAVRGSLAFLLLLTLAAAASPQRGGMGGSPLAWAEAALWLGHLSCLMLAALLHQLVGLDAPHDSTAFTSTRALSRLTLFTSKALVMVMAVLVVALGAGLRVALAGQEAGLGFIVTVVMGDTVVLMACLGLLSLAHSLRACTWQARTAVLLLVAGLFYLSVLQLVNGPLAGLSDMTGVLLSPGVVGWAALAGAYAHSLTVWRRAGALLFAGVASLALTGTLGSARTFELEQPAAFKSGPDLQPRLTGGASGLTASLVDGVCSVEIRRTCQLQNLLPGVFALPMRTHGRVIIGDTDQAALLDESTGGSAWTIPPVAALHALPEPVQLAAHEEQAWNHLWLPVAHFTSTQVQSGDMLRLTLKGEHHFDLYRTELVSLLPVVEGLAWQGNGASFEFKDFTVESSSQVAAMVEMDMLNASPLNRNILAMASGHGDWAFYGVNTPGRSLCRLEALESTRVWSPLHRRVQSLQNWRFQPVIRNWSIPGESTPPRFAELDHRQTKLGIFRRIKVGHWVSPYEFKDITLQVR